MKPNVLEVSLSSPFNGIRIRKISYCLKVSFLLPFLYLWQWNCNLSWHYFVSDSLYCRRVLQPAAAGEQEHKEQAGVAVLGPGRDHDGHVVLLHHRGVLLRSELLPPVQPPPQDGRLRHRLNADHSRIFPNNNASMFTDVFFILSLSKRSLQKKNCKYSEYGPTPLIPPSPTSDRE